VDGVSVCWPATGSAAETDVTSPLSRPTTDDDDVAAWCMQLMTVRSLLPGGSDGAVAAAVAVGAILAELCSIMELEC
jgi:hypothetical protein